MRARTAGASALRLTVAGLGGRGAAWARALVVVTTAFLPRAPPKKSMVVHVT